MTRTRMLWAAAATLCAAVLLGIVVVTGAHTAVDDAWHDAMVAWRPDALVAASHALNRIGGGWIAVLVVPGIVLVALLLARRARAALFAAAAFLVSVGLVQLLKQIFGRARPEDMLVLSDYGSFPSGHTANAATVAVVLIVLFPRWWTVLAGAAWALLMALSRTVLAVHWLTDTVGGMLIGVAAVLIVAAVMLPWVRQGRAAPRPGEGGAPRIRPSRPKDRDALLDVCVRTADAGGDATGIFRDDELWGLIYAAPYAERHPDLCWVVEAEDGRVIGYLVATDDTEAFAQWFRAEWWPRFADRFPPPAEPATREERTIAGAYRRGTVPEPHAAEYPAHLHIDLLPEAQGRGLGRRLMETLFDELERRGVAGLHLGMDPANTGAAAFYDRLGMERLPGAGMSYGVRFPR